MALDAMKVFNEYIMPSTIETLAQMVDKFNGASNGAIRLTTQGFDGDFLQESFWAGIHSAQRRVDRYAANGAQASTALSQAQKNGVKIAGGFGPILFEPSQLTWLQKPTAEGIEVASRNFAEALLKDQLNSAIKALVAAISNVANVTNDVSGSAAVTQLALNNTYAKFGDASSRIVANVMDGMTFHKLIGQNISNANSLFVAGNVTVIDILGRAIIVTDAPDLYTAGTPNKNKVLALVDSAAVVYDGGDVISNIQTTNGKERIETTMQVDYTFGLSLKGFAWDITNGGKSPTDAEIGTGTNWDKVVTSDKDLAGAICIGSADI